MSGLFISFEGGDGSGKSTQAYELARWLESQRIDVVLTREPGGTELGAQIRELLLHGDDVAPRAEALLFAADRAHHVASKIRPALERGAVVIGDRYLDSSVAYQGASRDLGTEEVRALSMWAVEELLPELTVLVDIPADEAAKRVGKVQDRLESEGRTFHERVREQYLEMAKKESDRFVIVDGNRSIAEISADVRAIVEPLIERLQNAESTSDRTSTP